MPGPISVTVVPGTQDLLIGDNWSDLVLRLFADEQKKPLVIHRFAEEASQHLQCLSVALTKDGYLVVAGTDPLGVFRFRPGSKTPGKSLDKDSSGAERVRTHASSRRWVPPCLAPFRWRRVARLGSHRREFKSPITKSSSPMR